MQDAHFVFRWITVPILTVRDNASKKKKAWDEEHEFLSQRWKLHSKTCAYQGNVFKRRAPRRALRTGLWHKLPVYRQNSRNNGQISRDSVSKQSGVKTVLTSVLWQPLMFFSSRQTETDHEENFFIGLNCAIKDSAVMGTKQRWREQKKIESSQRTVGLC
jgi:hypothetical protein